MSDVNAGQPDPTVPPVPPADPGAPAPADPGAAAPPPAASVWPPPGVGSSSSGPAAPSPIAAEPAPRQEAPRFAVGGLVHYRFFDPYVGAGGDEVSRYGIVLEVVDHEGDEAYRAIDGTFPPPSYRVGWLDAVSDPLAGDALAEVT